MNEDQQLIENLGTEHLKKLDEFPFDRQQEITGAVLNIALIMMTLYPDEANFVLTCMREANDLSIQLEKESSASGDRQAS